MLQNGLTHARVWHIVDAKDKVLGKVAQRIGIALRGKYKPTYNPSVDSGDYVVVKNCGDIFMTGKKMEQKQYFYHSGYPGGEKFVPFERLQDKNPTAPIKKAVYGTLPRNNMRREQMKRLFLFAGEEHPYNQNEFKSYENTQVVPLGAIKAAKDTTGLV